MTGDLELVGRLGLALVLSAAIGLERELRQKSAGLRTYTLVGLGAALFSIAGAYGRQDAVRGLTTAAGVWLTAAIGLAAAAGQALLAILATAAYMVVAFGFPVA